jgi:hypothetical protein
MRNLMRGNAQKEECQIAKTRRGAEVKDAWMPGSAAHGFRVLDRVERAFRELFG